MSNKQTPIIIAVVVVVILALLFFFGGGGRSYGWVEHYRPDSKDPFGTYLVHELLKDYFPNGKMEVLQDSLPGADSLGNYVFIGSRLWLDSTKLDKLLRFVEEGNDAFIACSIMPLELLDSISQTECIDLSYEQDSFYFEEELAYYFEDTSVFLSLLHGDLYHDTTYSYTFKRRGETKYYTWEYLPYDLFCEDQTVLAELGLINDGQVNFARAKYGEGHFYLHTTPLAFTNYYMLEEPGLAYAERVFSHLPARPIFWDRTGRGGGGSGSGGGGRMGFGESPLRYILSQPALRWAWYILLGMAVLYLAFKAKRRQRIIPVLEKNENTSLEFINTIGRLFFIQNNHRELALQKMKLFLGYVRERYHISTKELNEQFQKQLATRSEVPQEVIKKIITIHGNIERTRFSSENTLVELHRAMEKFYQACK